MKRILDIILEPKVVHPKIESNYSTRNRSRLYCCSRSKSDIFPEFKANDRVRVQNRITKVSFDGVIGGTAARSREYYVKLETKTGGDVRVWATKDIMGSADFIITAKLEN